MSLKKLCSVFAVGVFMILISVTTASACPHDHSALGSPEHVSKTNHRVRSSTISSPVRAKDIALKDSAPRPNRRFERTPR